jgi:hypothetical protein
MIALDINCVRHMMEIIEGKEISDEVRENVICQLKIKIRNEDMRIRQVYIRTRFGTVDKKDMSNFQRENPEVDL